jgi:RNA polymerase sigma-70 factor (ECF subfamily)
VTERSDTELLRGAARGDDAALTGLYERHVDGLYAFVFYRVGRDRQLAEDVVQATFLHALERADEFDPRRGSFRAWLHTSSRNVMRTQLRGLRRSTQLVETWERIDATLTQVFQALEQAPLGDEVIAHAQTRDVVNMTIANLPEHYRLALESKYVHGNSLEQLAASMSMSEQAAKSLLARARAAFRDTFATLTVALGEGSDA